MPMELPNEHVRLVFAAMLYQDSLIDAGAFRGEARAAYGAGHGDAIAETIIRRHVRVASSPTDAAR